MTELDTTAPPPAAPAAEPPATPDWREGMSEEVRNNPTIKDTASLDALGQRLIETKALVGNSLRMPTNEAGQEGIDAFTAKILANENLGLMKRPDSTNEEAMGAVYDSLGRPETAEGYAAMEGADPASFKALAAHAHKLGMSKTQFEGLAQAQIAMQEEHVTAMQAEQQTGLQNLRAEWGDAYDEKIGRAATMLDLTGAPKDLIEAVASGDIGANVLQWVDKLANSLGTEGAPMAQDLTPVTANTVIELKQKRDEITQRLLNEPLSQTQQSELQQRNIKISEQIIKAEGRE